MIDVKHCLKDHAFQNIPLNFDEAYSLGQWMLEGCRGNNLAQIQSVSVLCALHTKNTYSWRWNKQAQREHEHQLPETAAEQIAGLCAAIFKHDLGESKFGFLRPNVPYAIDNCGMGGDLIVTANVSTIAAFIAAVGGIPICKHGSPANVDKGRHGSSDFINLCGINRFAPKKEVERCIESLNFGYTDALDTGYKIIHLQTHEVAKLPHMNDIIGPITNPLDPRQLTHRILGINHLIPPRVVANAYHILNTKGITFLKRGLFVRGFVDSPRIAGMDELSICEGGSQIVELVNGEIKEYLLHAKDFGLKPVPLDSVSPPKGKSKGDFSLSILKREASRPSLQMVSANAALLFYLVGKSPHLKECYERAEEILMSGQAYQKMLEVRKMLPKEAV